jgi:hypothetical protein
LGKIFTERFGSRSGRSERSPVVVICGEREEERKKKEPDQAGIGGRAPVLLVPYYVQSASVRLAP